MGDERKSGPRLSPQASPAGCDDVIAALVLLLDATAEHPDVRAKLMGAPIVIARSSALRALGLAGVHYAACEHTQRWGAIGLASAAWCKSCGALRLSGEEGWTLPDYVPDVFPATERPAGPSPLLPPPSDLDYTNAADGTRLLHFPGYLRDALASFSALVRDRGGADRETLAERLADYKADARAALTGYLARVPTEATAALTPADAARLAYDAADHALAEREDSYRMRKVTR